LSRSLPYAGLVPLSALRGPLQAEPQPLREAAQCEVRDFDDGRGVPELAGQIVYQDMELAEGVQAGMHSRGYADAYLPAQESRVRFFHEVLNDWLEGRK